MDNSTGIVGTGYVCEEFHHMTLMKLKARVHIRLAEPHVSVCDLSACDLRGPSFRGFCVFLFFWGPFPLFLGEGGNFSVSV